MSRSTYDEPQGLPARTNIKRDLQERATGLEPATTSLEGWCATNCATPAKIDELEASRLRLTVPPRSEDPLIVDQDLDRQEAMQGVGFEPT